MQSNVNRADLKIPNIFACIFQQLVLGYHTESMQKTTFSVHSSIHFLHFTQVYLPIKFDLLANIKIS